jgi:archaellum component FlaC
MDLRSILAWLSPIDLLQTVFMGALAIYSYSIRHSLDALKKVAEVNDDVERLESRLDKIESAVLHAPTHNDLAKLYERLNSVSENLHRVAGTLDAQVQTIHRIESHLLNQK